MRHLMLVLVVACAAAQIGCENEQDRLQRHAASAATAGRAALATALHQDWLKHRLTFDSAVTAAHDMLIAGDPGATVFAGAVLDLGEAIEDEMPTGPEFFIFHERVGGLAFRAANAAYEAAHLDEADSLVLAGPKLWQTPFYWNRNPEHDALVCVIMALKGDKRHAIARLQARDDLPMQPELQEVIQAIRALPDPTPPDATGGP